MISSVRFSALPQPIAQRKSPAFASAQKPAVSAPRFGGGHSGFVYATMISGALLMGFGLSNATRKRPKLMVPPKAAPQALVKENISVLSGIQTQYKTLSSAEDKLNFLIKTVGENHFKNIPTRRKNGDERDEIAQWTIQEAAKLPEDKQKIKFILSALDNDPNPLQGWKNESIALSGIQDLTLRHRVKMLFDAKHQGQAEYDKQWQALAKALESTPEKPLQP